MDLVKTALEMGFSDAAVKSWYLYRSTDSSVWTIFVEIMT